MNNIKNHYDKVSLAWQIIMGDNQHYGLYKTGIETLNQASQNLIDVMLKDITLYPHSQVLDVGCGTGGPAFYIYKHFQPFITGIALGESEIAAAKENNEKNLSTEKISFLQADGQANGLDDESFDFVLMMESALLVPNKEKLFSENYRVLKNHGSFILCDQTRRESLSPAQMYRYGKRLEALQSTFGETKTESLEGYVQLMKNSGFVNIKSIDVTHQVKQSPSAWRQSCINNREEVLKLISQSQFDEFIIACETLEEFLEKNILSYGIVRGDKNINP